MKTKAGLSCAIVGGLMAQGCLGQGPLGEVRVSNMSTMASGQVIVDYRQLYSKGFECCADRHRRLIVSASGESEDGPIQPPVLTRDCSNSPASSGLCIPVVPQLVDGRTFYSAGLPDGTRVERRDSSARPYALSRFAGNDPIWTRESTAPADAVREKTLLVVRDSNIAEMLDVYTGEPLWSLEPPDHL